MDAALAGKNAFLGRVLVHKKEQEAKREALADGGTAQLGAAQAAMRQRVEAARERAAQEAVSVDVACARRHESADDRTRVGMQGGVHVCGCGVMRTYV